MNKFVYYCFATVALLVLTGCAAFRVNMSAGYGPHTPPTPAPKFPATEWVDVGNWQTFLAAKGFLPVGKFKLNTFDAATEAATKKFQKTPGKVANYELPDTGCVNFATYNKALKEGMPKYPKVFGDSCNQAPKVSGLSGRHHALAGRLNAGGVSIMTIGNGEDFHIPMKLNCKDNTFPNDPQVTDWQKCLICLGYMSSHNGTFDINTQTSTALFQVDSGLSQTGIVNNATFQAAQAVTSCKMNVTENTTSGCP